MLNKPKLSYEEVVKFYKNSYNQRKWLKVLLIQKLLWGFINSSYCGICNLQKISKTFNTKLKNNDIIMSNFILVGLFILFILFKENILNFFGHIKWIHENLYNKIFID